MRVCITYCSDANWQVKCIYDGGSAKGRYVPKYKVAQLNALIKARFTKHLNDPNGHELGIVRCLFIVHLSAGNGSVKSTKKDKFTREETLRKCNLDEKLLFRNDDTTLICERLKLGLTNSKGPKTSFSHLVQTTCILTAINLARVHRLNYM